MKSDGFTLIEILIAVSLAALISLGLAVMLSQTVKAKTRLEIHLRLQGPLTRFQQRITKDLRASVRLSDYPFEGKQDTIAFPAVLPAGADEGGHGKALFLVKYRMEKDCLTREAAVLPEKAGDPPKKERLICGIRAMKFLFPYRGERMEALMQPFWLEDPYIGLPKAVALDILWKGGSPPEPGMYKMISIPQGVMGTLASPEPEAGGKFS